MVLFTEGMLKIIIEILFIACGNYG